MKRRLVVAGGVLLGLLTLAGATYAPPLSLDQQAVKAEVIVRATVGAPATVQESAQSWTVYPLTVLEMLAGDAAALPKYQDRPAVWVLGGLTEGPTLKSGEAMLLLYKARLDSPLVGFTQGQYSVDGPAERKLVSGLPDGTPGVTKAPPPILTPSAGASAGASTTTPSAGATITPSAGTSAATTSPSAAVTAPAGGTITPAAASMTPSAGTTTTPSAGTTTTAATSTPSAATTTTPPTLGERATITALFTTPSAAASTPSAAASTTTPSSAATGTSTPSVAASGTATSSPATTPSAAITTPSTATTPSSAATPPAPTPPASPAAPGPGQLTLDAFRQAVLAARAKAGK